MGSNESGGCMNSLLWVRSAAWMSELGLEASHSGVGRRLERPVAEEFLPVETRDLRARRSMCRGRGWEQWFMQRTATRPVRCMNRNQQPRPLPVLWRARRSLVSTGQDWSATDLSTYRMTPPCDASQLSSYIQAAVRTHYSEFMHSPNTSGPIQNT